MIQTTLIRCLFWNMHIHSSVYHGCHLVLFSRAMTRLLLGSGVPHHSLLSFLTRFLLPRPVRTFGPKLAVFHSANLFSSSPHCDLFRRPSKQHALSCQWPPRLFLFCHSLEFPNFWLFFGFFAVIWLGMNVSEVQSRSFSRWCTPISLFLSA